ncbi:MAG: RNA polymerase factor sigma-54 [Acidobacteriota bacterium]
MTINQKFDVKQIQKLIMTPALQKSLKLLPLPNLELARIIEEEIALNPMLEISTEDSNQGEEILQKEVEDLNPAKEDINLDEFLASIPEESFFFPDETINFDLFENIPYKKSIKEYLTEQVMSISFNEEEKGIAEKIIENLDERGFLISSVKELSEREDIDFNKLIKTKSKLQEEIDPQGIASDNFYEYLKFQLKKMFKNPSEIKYISEQLMKFEKNQGKKPKDSELQYIKKFIEKLKKLKPYPMYGIEDKKPEYFNADVIIMKEENGYSINLNTENVPVVRINRSYLKLLKEEKTLDSETRKFLKEKKKTAEFFLKSIDLRNKTIFKIAKIILENQREFFEKGINYIKPMKMKDIASSIGIDESTVSRAVANKNISTPHGIFPIKFFFHSSLPDSYGHNVSSYAIKNKIRRLVEEENKNSPLTDLEILEIFRVEGIKISRRTVTKYREEMKIPPSYLRKKNINLGV